MDRLKNNSTYLAGFLCKMPHFRTTPSGKEITELLLAVNRKNGQSGESDYIPCICWGSNAEYASGFKTGDLVELSGRIQSREYYKKLSDEQTEKRVAYEVSGQYVKLLKSKGNSNVD